MSARFSDAQKNASKELWSYDDMVQAFATKRAAKALPYGFCQGERAYADRARVGWYVSDGGCPD